MSKIKLIQETQYFTDALQDAIEKASYQEDIDELELKGLILLNIQTFMEKIK